MAISSSTVFAGAMESVVCSPVDVTVPCQNCAWDLGGRALYLRPSSINSNASLYSFQTQGYTDQTLTNPLVNGTRGVDSDWGWGFQLEASYHYSTGNDLSVNWYYFRNGQSSNPIRSYTIVTPPNDTENYGIYNLAYSANPNWDQVNIEFGQHIDFGENKFARLHAGFNFSRFGTNGYANYVYDRNALPQNDPEVNITDGFTTLYNGFGPRTGLDLNYEWGNGFGIYLNGALSVLAGSSKTAFNRNNWGNPANTFTVSSTQTNIVGEVDAKMGLMYTYPCSQGNLDLDVGWLWAAYNTGLYPIHNFDVARGNQFRTNNFAIQGLYFGAKWVGSFV